MGFLQYAEKDLGAFVDMRLVVLEIAHRVAEHGLAIHVMEPTVFKMALCYDITDAQIDEALDIFQKALG